MNSPYVWTNRNWCLDAPCKTKKIPQLRMLCDLSHPRKISICVVCFYFGGFFSPCFPYDGVSALMNKESKSLNLLLSSLHVPWGCLTQGSAAVVAVGGLSVILPPFHLPCLSAATFCQPDFLGRQEMCDCAADPFP